MFSLSLRDVELLLTEHGVVVSNEMVRRCACVWDDYDEIVAACADAWNCLVNDPARIRSIGSREWATVNL